MEIIYIDTLLCVNLFIDYIILLSVKKTLHINCKHSRIILGAAIGSLSTIAIFSSLYTTYVSVMYRIITATIITLVSYGKTTLTRIFIRAAMYFGFSMILCGIILVIELTVNPTGVSVYNDAVYFDISPVILILSTISAYIIISIYNKIQNKTKLDCSVVKVRIHTNDENALSFDSMIDTGCNLKEPFSGLPVILIERQLLKNISLDDTEMRVIPFNTASGEGMVMAFRPQKAYINNNKIESECYIGICDNKLTGEIKSIIGPELAEVY